MIICKHLKYDVAAAAGKESPSFEGETSYKYSAAVIGKGESYICRDGSWADMASDGGLITLLGDPDKLKYLKENDTQLDNFNIKAYGLVR